MDPNLLPTDLRSQEEKEQARLKKQPVGFGVELNMPEKAMIKSQGDSAAKKPGFWSSLLGRPVSPLAGSPVAEKLSMPGASAPRSQSVDLLSAKNGIKKPADYSEPMSKPIAPNIEWQRPTPAPVKADPLPAKISAGDSWSEIFTSMFNFGRKKRIDFRLASGGASGKKVAPPAAPAPAVQPSKPADNFSPYHAVSVQGAQAEAGQQKTEPETDKEKPAEAQAIYHLAPKRERISEVNVNLMPQELLANLSGGVKNIQSILIAIIVPVIIISLGYGIMILLQNDLKSRMTKQQQVFDGLERQIGDFVVQEQQNNQIADRVAAIKQIWDNKIMWSKFFTYLEKYTLDGVYFNSLTADNSGVLTLPGTADNYVVLAQQIAALRDADDFIKDVKLTNAQLVSADRAGVIGVGFQLRLTLQANVFKKLRPTQ